MTSYHAAHPCSGRRRQQSVAIDQVRADEYVVHTLTSRNLFGKNALLLEKAEEDLQTNIVRFSSEIFGPPTLFLYEIKPFATRRNGKKRERDRYIRKFSCFIKPRSTEKARTKRRGEGRENWVDSALSSSPYLNVSLLHSLPLCQRTQKMLRQKKKGRKDGNCAVAKRRKFSINEKCIFLLSLLLLSGV